MSLREEIAKVRMARGRLEVTRAKLDKLDEDQKRLEGMRGKVQAKAATPETPARQPRRRKLDLE
ncbi:MAG TPA: hypothetical protein VNG93_06800 [Candidatus Dormibacteraeota bacterium]|nr:hypothetical protein [Candidatus Dormibacteraeota bacterium]